MTTMNPLSWEELDSCSTGVSSSQGAGCLTSMQGASDTYDEGIADEVSMPMEGTLHRVQESSTGPVRTTVFDVAAYILRKIGETNTIKLQKLVYYCQAWSLVWDDKPLYEEPIEAWVNGPVVRKLFDYHRGQFAVSEVRIGNPDVLTKDQRETVDAVISFYGEMSGQDLVSLSHAEPPWRDARRGLDALERGNRLINIDAMAEYYGSL